MCFCIDMHPQKNPTPINHTQYWACVTYKLETAYMYVFINDSALEGAYFMCCPKKLLLSQFLMGGDYVNRYLFFNKRVNEATSSRLLTQAR